MENVFNIDIEKFKKPWEIEKFDDIYERDERFFSILIKGVLNWLTRNILMYNKPIKHYIMHTGSSYMYVESNGYSYTENEVSGEDWMYTELPRCICKYNDLSVATEELSNPFVTATYERKSGNNIVTFNAETRRLPIELSFHCDYLLSNMNEALILQQELLDKLIFQRYFNIIYLGNVIQCSIEFPNSFNIEVGDVDLSSPDFKYRQISIDLKICSNYPIINERTEKQNVYLNELELNTQVSNDKKEDLIFN